MLKKLMLLAVCAAMAFVFAARANAGTAYVTGDVFVAVGDGTVNEYTASGTLVQSMNDGQGGFTTGMAFDGAGNLYVTNFSAGTVSKFDNSGNLLNATYVTGIGSPEAIVFNQAGDMFVTSVGGTGITEYSSTGTLLATYIAGTRTDWMDLAANQTTMLYTDESGNIYTLDLTTNTKQANFYSSNTEGAALRILADGSVLMAGEGSGVVDHVVGGVLSNTYTVGGAHPIGFPFALNLDPNGTSFWTADPNGNVDEVNIATGTIQNGWNSGSTQTFGLAVFGEITQGGPPPGVPEPASLLLLTTGICGIVAKRRFRKS